jgi:hypothetical protein
MPPTSTLPPTATLRRELARRSDSRIVVRLLWDEQRDEVLVAYRDHETGDRFTAQIPREEALEAFRHPNAYRRRPAAADNTAGT